MLFAIPFEDDYTLLGTTDVETEADSGARSRNHVPRRLATSVRDGQRVLRDAGLAWRRRMVLRRHPSLCTTIRPRTRARSPATTCSTSIGGSGTAALGLRRQDHHLPPARRAGGRTCWPSPWASTARTWTRDAPLPGGDIPGADIGGFTARCAASYPWLPQRLVRHYVRHYGTDIHTLLAGCAGIDDLGEHFGAGLHAAEVEFLVEHEWARTPEDILWRRTKKGLTMSGEGERRLQEFLEAAAIPADGPHPADSFEASTPADEE